MPTTYEIQGLHNPTQPADDAELVTPNNSASIDLTRGLYIGTTGDVRVLTRAGTDIIIPNVPAGVTLSLRVTKVFATSTTASDIVAWY